MGYETSRTVPDGLDEVIELLRADLVGDPFSAAFGPSRRLVLVLARARVKPRDGHPVLVNGHVAPRLERSRR